MKGSTLVLALAVVFGGVYTVVKEDCAVTDYDSTEYDLKGLKSPVLTGLPMKVFVNLVETWPVGTVLLEHLKKDSGFGAVLSFARSLPMHIAPAFSPLTPPDAASVALGDAAAAFDLQHPADSAESTYAFSMWTTDDYARAYRAGTLTPSVVAAEMIRAVRAGDEQEPPLRAFVAIDEEDLLSQAAQSDARFAAGAPLGVFDGVPIAIKDEFDAAGYNTTAGTAFISNLASEDATAVARLREAGALICGKTNMVEIGISVTGHNAHWGVVRNPYNKEHYTGGSSSGSAAAVAAGFVPVALAADGGGSIRIPAALCGMVGLKPTYGRVSEHGAFPLCWSVAHAGPIGVTVRDVALSYAIMAGPDEKDPNSLVQPRPHLTDLGRTKDLSDIRIGVFDAWFDHASAAVRDANREMLGQLVARGATIVDIKIPHMQAIVKAHLAVITSEMGTAVESHYGEHRDDFGYDVRTNLAVGRSFSSRQYVAAQRIRSWLKGVMANIFTQVDVIATPATGISAPVINPASVPDGIIDVALLGEISRFANVANLAGNPGITFPVGYDQENGNVPVAMQLMADNWAEHVLLRVAAAAEAAFQSARTTPPSFHVPAAEKTFVSAAKETRKPAVKPQETRASAPETPLQPKDQAAGVQRAAEAPESAELKQEL